MRDRIPGAPGQYKAVIAENQLAAMQAGEQFVITLVRDDQPVVEGTPYNKESVLPEELARALCPDIDDPTLADALAALLPKSGGAMTGSVNMNGNSIVGGMSINASFINGARIRCYKAGTSGTEFTLDRGGHCAYLIVCQTSTGVCVYAVGATQESTTIKSEKLCGGEYSNVGIACSDTRSITIGLSPHAVCFVISADNWNL